MLCWVPLGCPRASRAAGTRIGEYRDDCRRVSGFGREALLNILAYLATLLASECWVMEATIIQLNIIFVLADDPNLATRQLLALGPALTEKGNFFENAFVDYSTRCVAPRATILTSLYSHNQWRKGQRVHRRWLREVPQ
jgi:hypothetical protein